MLLMIVLTKAKERIVNVNYGSDERRLGVDEKLFMKKPWLIFTYYYV